MNALKATTNHPDNGERMRNLLRGREALPAQPENRFSARSGIGFVDGRQSRYGKSPDDHNPLIVRTAKTASGRF